MSYSPLSKFIILFVSLIVLWSKMYAQTTSIKGKIQTSKPVSSIVFLNGTTFQTTTDPSGIFQFSDVPLGYYQLVAVAPTYKANCNDVPLFTTIESLSMSLTAEQESRNSNVASVVKKKDLEIFLESLGRKKKDYQVANPEKLTLNIVEKALTASSKDLLVIKNNFLGYEMKILLSKYKLDLSKSKLEQQENNLADFEGKIAFSELQGSAKEENDWKTNRIKIYNGSAMHFYRALISNNLKAEGFSINPIISKVNSKRPSDSLINAKISEYSGSSKGVRNIDSIKHWQKQQLLPKYNYSLYKDTLKAIDIITKNSDGTFTLKYPHKLYVEYNRPSSEFLATADNSVFDFTKQSKGLTAVIELLKNEVVIDGRGILKNSAVVTYTGGWSPKLGEILPSDYQPFK